MNTIELPIIVCGEPTWPSEVSPDQIESFEFETGTRVAIPRFTSEHVDAVRRATLADLHALQIEDIAFFVEEVGRKWMSPGYARKDELITTVAALTGYSRNNIRVDVDTIAHSMARGPLFEIIETDLEDAYYLDDFIPYKSVYRHAQPKGRVLHIMVGNVPMAGLFTLIRSIVTKNLTIAKLPKRDLATVLLFALSFIEHEPNHPISRSISVGYWETAGEVGRQLIDLAQVVCCWGKLETMNAVRKLVPYGKELIEFGPKRSLAVIGPGADVEMAAMRLAYDISVYDQEACFCPLQVFVVGRPCEPLVRALAYYLERCTKLYPRTFIPIDIGAHVNRVKLENLYDGHAVTVGAGNAWNIIVRPSVEVVDEHPLSRTIFVHPAESLAAIESVINHDVQTVAVFPFDLHGKIADAYTLRGATRIVEAGMVSKPRIGFAHDGIKPLSRMVNWVSVEKGAFAKYKYGRYSLEEANRVLFGGCDRVLDGVVAAETDESRTAP